MGGRAPPRLQASCRERAQATLRAAADPDSGGEWDTRAAHAHRSGAALGWGEWRCVSLPGVAAARAGAAGGLGFACLDLT